MRTKFAALALALTLMATAAEAQGRRVRTVTRPIADQYIVLLAGDDDPEAVGRETETLYQGRLRAVYRQAARGFAVRLSAQAAERLANDPRVLAVEQDAFVQTSDIQAAPPSWGLDRIDQRGLPLDQAFTYGHGTTPVYVHVIDTGIRTSHVEFGGRAFIGGDFVDDDNNPTTPSGNDDATPGVADGSDCNGHGTHVAGTIAGAASGVAKNATVFAYRALNCAGSGSTSSVIAAIDAITATTHRPAVVNMSLGGGASQALDDAVRRSIASGITYVVAAGNSGVDANGSSPARVAEAITVGATDASDVRASFSNYGASVDLFAPGVGIFSASISSDSAGAWMSGTSMASPHVAGIAALYLEQAGNRTAAHVHHAIVSGATAGLVINPGAGSPNLLAYSGVSVSVPPPPAPNQPPGVVLTSPVAGSTAKAPAAFTLVAAASDPDGSIAKVVFQVNGQTIATDTLAPYAVSWSNVPVGTYVLTALATDNLGATTTSPGVTVTVTPRKGGRK